MNLRKYEYKDLLMSFVIKPVLLGIGVAAFVLYAYPHLSSSSQFTSKDAITIDQSRNQWSEPASYASAVSQAAPSVVNIYTQKVVTSNANATPRVSLGSGVIMQDDGIILTNHHVIDQARSIDIILHDGRQAKASIIGTDPEMDLAVIKVDLPNLIPITVGEPEQARIGDVVLAIGNPSGIGQSVTQGIISAKRIRGLGLNEFENFIQTDADINEGSSGGALVDAFGNLLGINTATLNGAGASGISFAIPADAAVEVLSDILRYGRPVRGWLGVGAKVFFFPEDFPEVLGSQGFQITDIKSGGPAAEAGVRVGDVIFKINGSSIEDLDKSVKQMRDVVPGQSINLDVLRQDRAIQFKIIAGDRGLQK